MTEVEQPPQNGINVSAAEDEDNGKARPADIEQDMREMERRKRVEAIMGSKLFREELERIVDCARESGNAAGILQQLSDIVGVPSSRVGSIFKASTCMVPINDIRGVESMGYAKGEKILRCKLAATFRLLDLYGWTQGLGAQITARLKVDQEYFLVNPYGLLYHEITASSLNKVDMQGNVVEQGTTNFGVNKSHFILHSVVHAARPDIRCAIYIGCTPVVAISTLKSGLLPLTKDACVLGELSNYLYTSSLNDEEERNKLVRNLGPNSKVMLLTNHGALCCGETIEEAFFAACHIVQACETQLKLLPVGLDNLVLIPEESRKIIYEQSRRPPEDLETKFAAAAISDSNKSEEEKKEGVENKTKVIGQAPKWRVGGAEFEALMRMLDNAGYRTGYIYRHPLIKSEPPKPKNDVELPPAVSSLGYLLEEEELFRQGIWKKGDLRKGGDRSRWLNSPNVYQKVEVLETGTPDPKKITKWVAEGSPTHSTPVRIDDPLQFVPVNTNPKEFKRVQQQIKDNRRADKISAGPQSHILEGVTWDEANRIKDATVSSAGDHVVLMGAASKGIIQRGFQHNATVYKAPYAKNPFDNVTDDELNEYKRTVERKKKSIHGEYTDTDFSESEALSSLQTSGAQQQTKKTTTTTTTTTAAVSQSEPEDISEHQVMRIQTKQAPVPSQPEVVLSDDVQFLKKTYQLSQDHKTYKSFNLTCHSSPINQHQSNSECGETSKEDDEQLCYADDDYQENNYKLHEYKNCGGKLIKKIEQNVFYQKQKEQNFSTYTHTYTNTNANTNTNHEHAHQNQGNGSEANFSIYNTHNPYQYRKKEGVGVNTFYNLYTSRYALTSDREQAICCDENLCMKDKYLEISKQNLETCCTPKICNKIFESILKTKTLRNQSAINCERILAANIRLQQQQRGEDKKIVKSQTQTKSNSPYRTVSHFGFNKPMRDPKPNHKHVATKTDNEQKYVPLRRSISYEEIFSSPRYLNLCEHCFELIVRLKPELMKCRIKLNNLIDNSSDMRFNTSSALEKNYLLSVSEDNVCFMNDNNNIVELTKPFSIFTLEFNRDDENNTAKEEDNLDDSTAVANSIFNEKIMSNFNYSELSSRLDSSPASLTQFEACNLNLSPHLCNKMLSDEFKECDNESNDINMPHKAQGVWQGNSELRKSQENSKKLMSREERSRRKLEFQEIWEDHINFAEHREYANDKKQESNNEKNAPQNQDVEEFKSTISRITFFSTKNQNSDLNQSVFSTTKHNDDDEVINDNQKDRVKCFSSLKNNSQQLQDLNNNLQQDLSKSETDTSTDITPVFKMHKYVDGAENEFNFQLKESSEKNTDKFSPLELTILEKIHSNDLNKSEDIFGKIENTIRNKISPSKLELLIRKQILELQDISHFDEKENLSLASESLNLSNTNLIDDSPLKSKNTFSLYKLNSSLPAFNSNKVTPFLMDSTQNNNNNSLDTIKMNNKTSSSMKKSIQKKDKKNRNFILENIRNASNPRQSPRIKRLHCNAEAMMIDKKLIFTPSRALQNEQNKSKIREINSKVISCDSSASSTVYTFQSKTVRGSPRYWISMSSQSATKKSQLLSPAIKLMKSTKKPNTNPTNSPRSSSFEEEEMKMATIETEVVNKVDAEINALGNEIQQIHPRLEKYKRNLDDFSHRVSDCINDINECVNAQENLINVHKKIKDCMKLREYSEQVMCRVQTFSLSETED